ncbi:MAG: type 1 glutamine amidotransferase [Pseudomonadota bacterium]
MLKILIVEGNSGEIIEEKRRSGVPIGSDLYRDALSIHAPEFQFDVSIPYAAHLQDRTIDIAEYDGFALTGSGVAWSSSQEEAIPYLKYIEKLFETGKPVIGSCWGMQTTIQVFGGKCGPNEAGTELGLAEDIRLSQAGRESWLFKGVPTVFTSPTIHRDHVTHLPKSFELLASNRVSRVQAVEYSGADVNFVGFQFHPEYELSYVDAIKQSSMDLPDTRRVITAFPKKPPAMVSDKSARTQVFSNWIKKATTEKLGDEKAA